MGKEDVVFFYSALQQFQSTKIVSVVCINC